MTERRFVLVDFRYTNDVVAHHGHTGPGPLCCQDHELEYAVL
jgi:hypothetical protein